MVNHRFAGVLRHLGRLVGRAESADLPDGQGIELTSLGREGMVNVSSGWHAHLDYLEAVLDGKRNGPAGPSPMPAPSFPAMPRPSPPLTGSPGNSICNSWTP